MATTPWDDLTDEQKAEVGREFDRQREDFWLTHRAWLMRQLADTEGTRQALLAELAIADERLANMRPTEPQ